MAQQAIEIFKKALQANQSDKYRQGNTIILPCDAELIISGDIHGNRRNFERIVNYANIGDNPKLHLVLQEIIHGGPEDEFGGCLSFELLMDAAKLKIKFPDQVHLIMGNHDTAFISHSEVMKNGKEMNQCIRDSLKRCFGDEAVNVDLEMARFLFSQPLAVKTANGFMISHSLPADRQFEQFDPQILQRELKINDIVRPGSVYLFTWGRKQGSEVVKKCSRIFDCKGFVVGHQPQETGFCRASDRLLILASDHNHGVILKFSCKNDYTIDDLVKSLTPLSSLV